MKQDNISIYLLCFFVLCKGFIFPSLSKFFRYFVQTVQYKSFLSLRAEVECNDNNNDKNKLNIIQNRNNKTLLDILKYNSNTEIGKEYQFNNINNINDFIENIPLSHFSDFQDKIDKLIIGKNNILSKSKIIYFATSSGTTGTQKMIPLTMDSFNSIRSTITCSVGSALDYNITRGYNLNNYNKALSIIYSPYHRKHTISGIPYGPISQCARAFGGILGYINNLFSTLFNGIPVNLTDKVEHFETNMLLQCFFSLLYPQALALNIGFASILNHFFVILRIHFKELILCIEEGNLYSCEEFVQYIPKSLLEQLNRYIQKTYSIKYRKKRVYELKNITNFEGIARKLWPNMLYVSASVSGSFSNYKDAIKYYLGDIPILGAIYLSSEATMGFQYNENGEYLFHPDSSFFEFIEECESNNNNPKTLLLSQLTKGKYYEIVVTTKSGFYRYRLGDVIKVTNIINNIPLFKIAYRTGSILDAYGEKTTEDQINNALLLFTKNLNINNCQLINFTSYLELDNSPVNYAIFVEFNINIQDTNISKDFDKYLRQIHGFYNQCREQNKLGPVNLKILKVGTFDKYEKLLIENGTACFQVKIPRLLKNPKHKEFFKSL